MFVFNKEDISFEKKQTFFQTNVKDGWFNLLQSI